MSPLPAKVSTIFHLIPLFSERTAFPRHPQRRYRLSSRVTSVVIRLFAFLPELRFSNNIAGAWYTVGKSEIITNLIDESGKVDIRST